MDPDDLLLDNDLMTYDDSDEDYDFEDEEDEDS